MMKLSLVMIVKNEEKVLSRCLNSIKDHVDEIVIVDTGSTDATVEIAQSFGASIFHFEWINDFSAARNYALERATGDWVLVLDADHYVSDFDVATIRNFMNRGTNSIGRVKIIDKFLDNGKESYAQSFSKKLFPSHIRYTGLIHEQVDSKLPTVVIPLTLQHDGYMEGPKTGRNLPLLETMILKNPDSAYYYFQAAREFRGMNDYKKCRYYLKQAFHRVKMTEPYACNVIVDYLYAIMADGTDLEEGINVISLGDQFFNDSSDFHFACGLYYLDLMLSSPQTYQSLLPQIENRYLRCLEIGDEDGYEGVLGTGSYAAMHNLAVFYETTGYKDLALHYFRQYESMKA